MPNKLTPPNLQIGDTVAIIATGKQITVQEILVAKDHLTKWGLKVVLGESIQPQSLYLAGNDLLRTSDLQNAINDPQIKAILFARGGYGTVRIIDAINFNKLKERPKWLIGFSDLTIMHTHIQALLNLSTIHGIMPIFFPTASDSSIDSLKQILFNGMMNYDIETNNEWHHPGECFGEITGGNLAMLASAAGSSSALDCKNKILFIEDLCEPYYKVDRMLQTLFRAGSINGIKGLIVGSFTAMEPGEPAFSTSFPELLLDYFKPLEIPIYFDFPAGHIDDNRALHFGHPVKMTVKDKRIILKTIK